MPQTLDLGLRIELHSMDKYCENISVGLYQKVFDSIPHFLLHTYSAANAGAARIEFLNQALKTMVGLIDAPDFPGWLRFDCGQNHLRALKRVFLDLCKLENTASLAEKPLTAFDKKADCNLTVMPLSESVYGVKAENCDAKSERRVSALVRGYVKLCEVDVVEGSDNEFRFPCDHSHNEMVGLLMFRAQNVRAAMQEEELSASRGRLTAPSQQDS